MAIVTKPHGDFVNNVDVANATYVDDQFNTLYNLINGQLDVANVKTGTFVQGAGDTMAGILGLNAGGPDLQLKPGTIDHAYMEFYARTATPTTRSGFLGYASAAAVDMGLTNSILNAHINISTAGTGLVKVNGNPALQSLSGGYKIQDSASSIAVATAGTQVVGSVVTFPVAFSTPPLVFISVTGVAGGMATYVNVFASGATATGFTPVANSGIAQNINYNWLAIGT